MQHHQEITPTEHPPSQEFLSWKLMVQRALIGKFIDSMTGVMGELEASIAWGARYNGVFRDKLGEASFRKLVERAGQLPDESTEKPALLEEIREALDAHLRERPDLSETPEKLDGEVEQYLHKKGHPDEPEQRDAA